MIELEATTWTLEPGHTLRLAIAGTDWPNCWPPPGPLTLEVDAGAIELVLPIVDAARLAALFRARRRAPHPTRRTASSGRIAHDVLARETTVSTRYGGTYDGLHGATVTDDYRGTLGVSVANPARRLGPRSQHATRSSGQRAAPARSRRSRCDRTRRVRRHDPPPRLGRRRRDRRPRVADHAPALTDRNSVARRPRRTIYDRRTHTGGDGSTTWGGCPTSRPRRRRGCARVIDPQVPAGETLRRRGLRHQAEHLLRQVVRGRCDRSAPADAGDRSQVEAGRRARWSPRPARSRSATSSPTAPSGRSVTRTRRSGSRPRARTTS